MLLKILISTTIALSSLMADIGHKELLNEFKNSHSMAKNFALESEVLYKKKMIQSSGKPYELVGTLAHAQDKYADKEDGFEYNIGIAKTFLIPHASEVIEGSIEYENKKILLEKNRELISYMYDLLDLYHQSCLQRETVSLYEQLSLELKELHKKNERAFELGEISKKDLILWHLEYQRIKLEFDKKKSQRVQIFRTLQSKFGSKLKIKRLTCTDLYDFTLPNQSVNINELLDMKQLVLSKNMYELKSEEQWFHEVGVELSYDNELDRERYNASFNIPLEFTAPHHKAMAQMNRLQELQTDNEIDAFKVKKHKELEAAYVKLKQAYDSYMELEGPMSEDAIKLMDLTQTAYSVGESTAIELITIRQYVMDILMQLQEMKSQFYEALFNYKKLSITGEEF